MNVLLVEDDHTASDYLAKALRELGHSVRQAFDGRAGLEAALEGPLDVVILDRMLPELEGLQVVREMRSQGVATPVLILSALDQVDDRVQGLRAGGDDYLTKPYNLAELSARLEALARRAGSASAPQKLKVADLELDRLSRRVVRSGRKIELTAREFQLLDYLMQHAGQVVTRKMILEAVWDYHFDPGTNVIDVHISRLRQSIDRGFEPALLQTVRGAGYRLGEEG